MSNEWYQEYLQSPSWAAKKSKFKKKLKRRQYKCEICCAIGLVQVHHKTYARVGREYLSDLMSLCDYCHGFMHKFFHFDSRSGTKLPNEIKRLRSDWWAHCNRKHLWGLRMSNPWEFARHRNRFFEYNF